MIQNNSKEYFMNIALEEAKKAFKEQEVPVGAIIVKDNKIIAKGYNKRESEQNSLLHAEIIAINEACSKLNTWRLEDCDIYVTLEPCLMCAGAIIQSRIRKLYFGCNDIKGGAIITKTNVLDLDLNHKVSYEDKILEQECSNILKDFFSKLRNN